MKKSSKKKIFYAPCRYKPWTEYEIEHLCDMFDRRCTISDICAFLGRTDNGIAAKLRRLGKIQERKELYKVLKF